MIWQELKKPFFVLAPMDDVTDTVFRTIVAECARPDVFFTEFVSVDGLSSAGRQALSTKLRFTDVEKPLIVQVWGMKPENYVQVAGELADYGYAGIDINMGCPVPKVIKHGACSALINDRDLAGRIIASTKHGAAGKVPVSVKTRIGYNKIDLSWIEFLLKQDIAALTVHARTVKELSKVPNHWEVMDQIVAMRDEIAPHTVLIANGDVTTRQQGMEYAEKYKVDGIMVGRGIFHDPYLFAENSPWHTMPAQERLALYEKHMELFLDAWSERKNPAVLKKFAKVYVNGFAGASELREAIMRAQTVEDMKEALHNFKPQ